MKRGEQYVLDETAIKNGDEFLAWVDLADDGYIYIDDGVDAIGLNITEQKALLKFLLEIHGGKNGN